LKIPRLLKRRTAVLAIVPLVLSLFGCTARWPDQGISVSRTPVIYPDYFGAVVPPNIAPLNFSVREPGVDFVVRLSGERGGAVSASSRDGRFRFSVKGWRRLLELNRGGVVRAEVAVKSADGAWSRFQAGTIRVAEENIDRYAVFRLIPPMDHLWLKIGIYERDLEGFSQKPVIENHSFSVGWDGCVNCHSFRDNRTDRMSLQIRSPRFGRPMIVVKDGKPSKVDTAASGFSKSPAAYQSWHPDGRRIAYSVNKVMPLEHTIGEHRDVWDSDSDLAVYDTEHNQVETTQDIADPERRETWPSWSADGRHLYFCSAPQVPLTHFYEVKYDLMRIPYDPATGTWGKREVVLSSADSGLSAAQPRVSPDGRWLLFSLADHGNFPIFQPSTDLYVIDLKSGVRRALTLANSAWSDSWHSWSSNGRWIAFASKRQGGVLARVYITYFDRNGRAFKPIVMPQEDPLYYESCTLTYNIPELVTEPVPVTPSELGRAITAEHSAPGPKLVRK